MSLFCSVGSTETDLSEKELKELLVESLGSWAIGGRCWLCRPTKAANIRGPAILLDTHGNTMASG